MKKLLFGILLCGLLGISAAYSTVHQVVPGLAGCTQSPPYAEGLWTPVVTTDGTVGTPSYTVQVGTYERNCRQYTVRFTIILASWAGSPTGTVSVTGIPAASANLTQSRGTCTISTFITATAATYVTGQILPNTAVILPLAVFTAAATTLTGMSSAQAGATFAYVGMCNYNI